MSSVATNCNNDISRGSLTIASLARDNPSAITKALTSLNLQSCYLTPAGECTQAGCKLTGTSSSTFDCNCLTFFANMNAGVYTGLTCIMNSAEASTTAIATSVQTINFSIVSPGDISNVELTNTQNASAKVTTMTMAEASNQDTLANISGKSIQTILLQAKQNPEMFSDPVSQVLIKAFDTYLANNPDILTSAVKQSVVSKVKAMTTSSSVSKNTINILIENSTWDKFKADLNQTACISLIAQTIAKSVVNNITNNALDALFKEGGVTIENLPKLCNPNLTTENPASPASAEPESVPTPAPSSTPAPKKKNNLLVIGGLLLLIIVIIIIVVVVRKKKKPQQLGLPQRGLQQRKF